MFDVPPAESGGAGDRCLPRYLAAVLRVAGQRSGIRDRVAGCHAGTEVAFAYALLRCGTAADLARDPEQRLRLTLGLRKTGGRWIVTHEHHSFPDTTGPDATPSSNVARS